MFKKPDTTAPAPDQGTPGDDSIPRSPAPAAASPASKAVIGPSIVFKGDVSGQEDLLVHGRIEGTIELNDKNLTVGQSGTVKANIHARVITVEGQVQGDLSGSEGIIVRKSGKVTGNMIAPRVNLEDGSKFKGSIDMEPLSSRNKSAVKSVEVMLDKKPASSA